MNSVWKTEPVRVLGYLTALVTFVAGVLVQVSSSYDKGTGWKGLVVAAVLALVTEIQRSQVSPADKNGGSLN